MYSDRYTPVEVMRILRKESRHGYLLESAGQTEQWGRYSFLGYDPSMEITCTDGKMRIRKTSLGGWSEEELRTVDHPGQVFREIIDENRTPELPGIPTFTGVRSADLEQSYEKAEAKLNEIEKLLKTGEKMEFPPIQLKTEIKPQFSEEKYEKMVEKAKHYIYEGDIFQVVLSNRLEADYEGSLFNAYRMLRTINPSPYMFYFSSDVIEVAGASPETLVKLEDGVLHTFPLAGTRPRGKDAAEDERLKTELLGDEKERAEHNMLVDLGRNDLGKVSKYGSVEVEDYMAVLQYSHVMHIGSTVRGEIRDDKDSLDAVDAVLPAGTLSGAPKIRAMEIINELENNKRGIYGGAIGYVDFTGNLDTCIAIRTVFKKNDKIFVRSGAGIVADSVPENEYHECINKAKAVMDAVDKAQGIA